MTKNFKVPDFFTVSNIPEEEKEKLKFILENMRGFSKNDIYGMIRTRGINSLFQSVKMDGEL